MRSAAAARQPSRLSAAGARVLLPRGGHTAHSVAAGTSLATTSLAGSSEARGTADAGAYHVVHAFAAGHDDELSVELGELLTRVPPLRPAPASAVVGGSGGAAAVPAHAGSDDVPAHAGSDDTRDGTDAGGAHQGDVDEGWWRVENARGDVGLVPSVILEREKPPDAPSAETDATSDDNDDDSVEARQRRKARRTAALQSQMHGLQEQMDAIRKERKHKRRSKEQAAAREHRRIQKTFKAARAAEQATARMNRREQARTRRPGGAKPARARRAGRSGKAKEGTKAAGSKKNKGDTANGAAGQAPVHSSLAESSLGDGARVLEEYGTTVEEQLALQKLQPLKYAAGTQAYAVNLPRHEIRAMGHEDLVFEKSLLIRQRLLNYGPSPASSP